jgi:hypothetical protein
VHAARASASEHDWLIPKGTPRDTSTAALGSCGYRLVQPVRSFV